MQTFAHPVTTELPPPADLAALLMATLSQPVATAQAAHTAMVTARIEIRLRRNRHQVSLSLGAVTPQS